MNPSTVLGQSIAIAIVLVVLAILGRPGVALAIALAGLVWVLAMNFSYARRLADRGRTARRRDGDRAIALQLLVSYVSPALTGLALIFLGVSVDPGFGPVRSSDVQGLLGVIAVMLLAWLGSSHVDWYYVRPRIDGVVVPPPCRTSRDTMWKGVTRKWYIHRAVASLVTMAAVVAVAAIVTVTLAREWPTALSDVGGFAAIIAAGLWLMNDEVKSAGPTARSIRSPRYWLGDDLAYETDMWTRRGFVLHVAIPVTKLIPLDFTTGAREPGAEPAEESATLLYAAHLRSRPLPPCESAAACRGLNRECTFHQPKDVKGSKRWLVI